MTTTITETRITSDQTSHHAWKALPWQGEGWIVTWTGGSFTRNQAITAISLAEMFADLYRVAAEGKDPRGHESWPLFADLSAELDMTPDRVWTDLADTYPAREARR